MIRCYPQAMIESGQVTADLLISIRGVDDPRPAIPSVFGAVLELQFDDVPFTTWTDRRSGQKWYGPHEDHLIQALEFGRSRPNASIAVHCKFGKSRSSAIAVLLSADRLGLGQEPQAVAEIIASSSHAISPNPFIVRAADRLLERGGRIEAALEKACPGFVTWRAYWRAEAQEDNPG